MAIGNGTLRKLLEGCGLRAASQDRTGAYQRYDFREGDLESELQAHASTYAYQQAAIANLTEQSFEDGTTLRALLQKSNRALKALIREFPPRQEGYGARFGETRWSPLTFSRFSPETTDRVALEGTTQFRSQGNLAMLQSRWDEEREANGYRHGEGSFRKNVMGTLPIYFQALSREIHLGPIFFTTDESDHGAILYTLPGLETSNLLLEDAELRLEKARELDGPAKQREFFLALFAYQCSRPYDTGGPVIASPVFRGIYRALMGRKLPPFPARGQDLRIAHGAEHFIEQWIADIERW